MKILQVFVVLRAFLTLRFLPLLACTDSRDFTNITCNLHHNETDLCIEDKKCVYFPFDSGDEFPWYKHTADNTTYGYWALDDSTSCKDDFLFCEGGTEHDLCNGNNGTCYDKRKCELKSDFVGTKKCTLEINEECYCNEGNDGVCLGDKDKCFPGNHVCTFDDFDGSCNLEHSTTFFAQCCEEGTFDNECNSNVGTCVNQILCTVSSEGKCVTRENSESCNNFCKNDLEGGENNCGGDIGCQNQGYDYNLCSLTGGENSKECFVDKNNTECFCTGTEDDLCGGRDGTCSAFGGGRCKILDGKCKLVDDMTCCDDGCNGYEMSCDGLTFCELIDDGVCQSKPNSVSECFCKGTINDKCGGDLDSDECHDGIGCGIVKGADNEGTCAFKFCDSGTSEPVGFCQGNWYERCNGHLNQCEGGKKCKVTGDRASPFICETVVDTECTSTPYPSFAKKTQSTQSNPFHDKTGIPTYASQYPVPSLYPTLDLSGGSSPIASASSNVPSQSTKIEIISISPTIADDPVNINMPIDISASPSSTSADSAMIEVKDASSSNTIDLVQSLLLTVVVLMKHLYNF